MASCSLFDTPGFAIARVAMASGRPVTFPAIHARIGWRKAHNPSIEWALFGEACGAKALFEMANDANSGGLKPVVAPLDIIRHWGQL